MKLRQLRNLPDADQQAFLLGRVAVETTKMDASLRFFHAALRRERDLDALLDAPDFFSQSLKECQQLLAERTELSEETRRALLRTLTRAGDAYALRNRYTHDLLRTTLINRQWELAAMSRSKRESIDAQPTSFDDMVRLILELIAGTWSLRGAGMHLLTGEWTGLALGHVNGTWSGDAEYLQ